MSPSVFIVRRGSQGRGARYQVRYRLGGREAIPQSAGTFATRREAEARMRWVAGELAGLRVPDLARLARRPTTVLALFDEWSAAAPASESQRQLRRKARALLGAFGDLDVEALKMRDVQGWINLLAERYQPATVRQYLSPVRIALDHADLDRPNPARDPRLVLPRLEEVETEPPSYVTFLAILDRLAERHRSTAVILERTGLRIEELTLLRWGDVDLAGRRIRVARGRTKGRTGGRRFVPLLPEVRAELMALAAPGDRQPALPAVPGFRRSSFGQALTRACERAGVERYSPHDLRHRYISLLVLAGLPITLVREISGHRRASMTLDRYSHVLLDEPAERLEALRRGVRVVSGLTGPRRVGYEMPALWDNPEGMGSTGIEPVTSRV